MKAVAVLVLCALAALTVASATESTVEVEAVDFDELEEENESFLQIAEQEETEQETEESDEAEDESEEESEAESEEEADSEEESEDETEAEGEIALETEGESATDSEAIAEFEAALGENAMGKWHVYSDTLTQKAHEGICVKAHSTLSATEKQTIDVAKLQIGAIWNDMPSGYQGDEAGMIKDGHMDVDTWTRLFFTTGGIDDLVFNVHYGCLQHWHSMAPIQRLQAKSPAGGRIVFTNEQVKGFTIAQIKYWWNKAVGHKTRPVNAGWYLGHILHAVQDSYPRGHTVRTSTASVCGDIVSFQGYDAQHGNAAHKAGDFTPDHAKHEADGSLAKRYQCAVDYSAAILRAFAACVAGGNCADSSIDGTLSAVYTLAAGAAVGLAGGSAEAFAKAGIATDANYQKQVVAGVTLYNPKSTNVWGGAGSKGQRLCGGTKEILSKSPTGFGVYREQSFTDYPNPTA